MDCSTIGRRCLLRVHPIIPEHTCDGQALVHTENELVAATRLLGDAALGVCSFAAASPSLVSRRVRDEALVGVPRIDRPRTDPQGMTTGDAPPS